MLNVRLLLTSATLTVSPAWSAQPSLFPPLHETLVTAAGWQGFTDIALIADVLLTLTLAAVLGAIIAFHPKNRAAMAMSEGIDSPKIYVIYPVIGAIVGIMVLHYGMVVGFVLFGIGGLLRFRTVLRSASLTGRIIFATLMGLACGLHLPHIAVLATAFGFTVVYILDSPHVYRVVIKELPEENFTEAISAYRALLENRGCCILREKKNCGKSRVTFILKCPLRTPSSNVEKHIASEIDDSLAGSVEWRPN